MTYSLAHTQIFLHYIISTGLQEDEQDKRIMRMTEGRRIIRQ